MGKIPIAVQLFSVRHDCERDLPGTLKAIAGMGYDGVEFAGYYGRTAQELRGMLDDLGLKVAGTHTGLDTLLPDQLDSTVDFNRILGNRFLIVPWLPDKGRQGWLDAADTFNAIAEKLQPLGMQTGYHNHHTEFTPVEGEEPWDTFFGNTRKDVVMQFDLGNGMHGGADPIPYLERYPGRATTIHLKEYSKEKGFVPIGEGDVPWQQVFRLCENEQGTEWYIVEFENEDYPALESIDRCLKWLRSQGK